MRAALLAVFAIACGGSRAPSPTVAATSGPTHEVSVEDMLQALPAHSDIIAVINFARLRSSPLARELYAMFADRPEVKLVVDGLCMEAFAELEVGVYGGTMQPKNWIGWQIGTTRARYDACRTSARHRDVAAKLTVTERVHDDVTITKIGAQTLQYLWTDARVMTVASRTSPEPELTAAQLRAMQRTPKAGSRGVLASPEMADLFARVDRNAGFWGFVSSAEITKFGLVAASYSFDITDQLSLSARLIASDETKATELASVAKPFLDRYVSGGQLERGEAVVQGREIHVRLLMTRAGLASLLPPLFSP